MTTFLAFFSINHFLHLTALAHELKKEMKGVDRGVHER
jgi:hypothetical protein